MAMFDVIVDILVEVGSRKRIPGSLFVEPLQTAAWQCLLDSLFRTAASCTTLKSSLNRGFPLVEASESHEGVRGPDMWLQVPGPMEPQPPPYLLTMTATTQG